MRANDEHESLPAVIRPDAMGLSLDPQTRQPNFWTTLKGDKEEGRRMILKALGDADYDADSLEGRPIRVSNLLTKRAMRVDPESSEVATWVRAVLIAADGTTVAFGSSGVIESLANIIALYGMPPWHPELVVKLAVSKIGGGHKFYRLELAGPEEPAKPKSK